MYDSVAHGNHGVIHAHAADDREDLAAVRHAAFVAQLAWHTFVVTEGQHRDAHIRRCNERAIIADFVALLQVDNFDDGAFQFQHRPQTFELPTPSVFRPKRIDAIQADAQPDAVGVAALHLGAASRLSDMNEWRVKAGRFDLVYQLIKQ